MSVWSFLWDKGEVKPNPRTEAAALVAEGRTLGYFDAPSLKPTVTEIEVWLNPMHSPRTISVQRGFAVAGRSCSTATWPSTSGRGSRSTGWRSRGRCWTSGRRPAIAGCSATCRWWRCRRPPKAKGKAKGKGDRAGRRRPHAAAAAGERLT